MATDIEDWLIAWFKRRNPTAIIDMTNDYYCSGLVDSFGIIELIGDLEKKFEIFFDDNEFQLASFRTLSGLVELVRTKIEA
jgi:acyl carrier protein